MMKTGILLAALFAATAACAQGAAPESPGQSPAAGIPWTLDDCIGFASAIISTFSDVRCRWRRATWNSRQPNTAACPI